MSARWCVAVRRGRGAWGETSFPSAMLSGPGPRMRPDRADGRDDAEHGAGRRALVPRRSGCVVRVPGVDARPDPNAVRRGRAVGMGAPLPALAWRASAARTPSPRGGLSTRCASASRAPVAAAATVRPGHVDRCLEPTQRETGNAGGFPGLARDRKRRFQPWHYAGFALARRNRKRPRLQRPLP